MIETFLNSLCKKMGRILNQTSGDVRKQLEALEAQAKELGISTEGKSVGDIISEVNKSRRRLGEE